MRTHGVTERDLAHVSSTEYGNANSNPYAQMKKIKVTLDDCANIGERNKYIIEGLPLKTYDCSQITDGYTAMIIATEEGLKRLGVAKADAVEIAGYAQATDSLLRVGSRRAEGRGRLHGDEQGVRDGRPHAGGHQRGGAARLLHGDGRHRHRGHREGRRTARARSTGSTAEARVDGECGINTSGGLIAKGHPVGATGVAMLGWAAWQLLGKVPPALQVKNAKAAATFNIGGPICASVCTVLKPGA